MLCGWLVGWLVEHMGLIGRIGPMAFFPINQRPSSPVTAWQQESHGAIVT
jgi:hypothetical protein